MAFIPILFTYPLPPQTDGTDFTGWSGGPPTWVLNMVPPDTAVWSNTDTGTLALAEVPKLDADPPGINGPALASFDVIYVEGASAPWNHFIRVTLKSNGTFTLENEWPTLFSGFLGDGFTPNPASVASRQEHVLMDGRTCAVLRAVDGNIVIELQLLNTTETYDGLTIYADVEPAPAPPMGEIVTVLLPPTSTLPPFGEWTDLGGGQFGMPYEGYDAAGVVFGDTHPFITIPEGLADNGTTDITVNTNSDGAVIDYALFLTHTFAPGMSSRRRIVIPSWGENYLSEGESALIYQPGSEDYWVNMAVSGNTTTITTNLPWDQPGLEFILRGEGGVGGDADDGQPDVSAPFAAQQFLRVKFPEPPPLVDWIDQSFSHAGGIATYKAYGVSTDGAVPTAESAGVRPDLWTRVDPEFAENMNAMVAYWHEHPWTRKPYQRTFSISLQDGADTGGPFFFEINGALLVPEYDFALKVPGRFGGMDMGVFTGFFDLPESGETALVEIVMVGGTYGDGATAPTFAPRFDVSIYTNELTPGETEIAIFAGTPASFFWTQFRESFETT